MKRYLFWVMTIFFLTQTIFAKDTVVLEAAKKELSRSMTELAKEKTTPYFISYEISDIKKYSINASFGNIINCDSSHNRLLDIDLRVGSYDFDNTHIIRGERFSFGGRGGSASLPLEPNEAALRSAIWFATDREYKDATEKFEKALTNKAVKVQEEDSSADFSHEEPYKFFGNEIHFNVDVARWTALVKELSLQFKGLDKFYTGSAAFTAELIEKYIVNSEGSELHWFEPSFRIMIQAKTKSEDGMSLPLYKSYFSFEQNGLPDASVIKGDIEKMITLLKNLRNAPLMITYTGPAILSGEAAGVFFHEIFGHRVEGHRQKDPNSSQTFKSFLGKKILPDFIDVIFDPTERELNNREISGYYEYDDEGVKAQKVVAVEKGVFKNFLMSRSPIENFSESNGHGRKQPGYSVCSRQSNLIVNARQSVPVAELKEMLRKQCMEQGKEYGLYFDAVQGGFTFTGRTIPNAFNVNPLVVYKVYADGRPDELVRGVDLIGTPLTTFSNIIAAGDDLGIFNGICGAESGGVSVSASSPSLLVSTIEVQKKSKSQAKPPILSAP
ncbi:MAG: TldD protein [Bacteroidota bacterium]|nr:TldD protein [Bacteroidota bacterium]